MDENIVLCTLRSNFKDFEDALKSFSANENEKQHFLLTRTIKDFKKSEVAIMITETYLNETVENI